MNISIRHATLDDLSAIQEIFVGAVRYVSNKDYTSEQIEVWAMAVENVARWEEKIQTQYFIVAEIAGATVGFASLERDDYFDLLYVHKDHLRKGVANALYQAIETASKAAGSGILRTDVSITARPMLERKGFELLHENRNLLHGVEIINYRMEKKMG